MTFIIIVAVFIAAVALSYISEEIKTENIETYLILKGLVNSESCLAYNDGTRIHQNIIDLNKLTSNRLSSCLSKTDTGYLITLTNLNGNLVKSESNLDVRQKAYLPICKSIKGFICTKKSTLINYYENNQIKTVIMNLEVIKLDK